jgi:hypothetical protein
LADSGATELISGASIASTPLDEWKNDNTKPDDVV